MTSFLTTQRGLAARIYDWLGFPISQPVLDDLVSKSLTSGMRTYIKRPVPKWKRYLTKDEITLINAECKYVIRTLGYSKKVGF